MNSFEILFQEKYERERSDALHIKEELLKKIDRLGDLSSPTLETVKFAVRECSNVEEGTGFLFFLLAFVWVPHPTRTKVRLRDNIYNWQCIAALKYLRHTKIIYAKRRQTSATTLTTAYFLWKSLFFGNTNNLILSIGSRESTDVLSRVSFIYEELPVWLKTPTKESAKTSITFKNSSRIRALPSSVESARGQSTSSLLIDEGAFIENFDLILAAAAPSLSMGFLTPFTNHSMPSQMFLVSTFPLMDSENNEYLRIYKKAITGDSDFEVIVVGVEDISEYQNKDWLKAMLEILGPKKYRVEIEGELNSTLDNSFLPEWVIEKLQPIHPIRTDFLRPEQVDDEGYAVDMNSFVNSKENYDPEIGYIKGLWIWSDPLPGRTYGVAADVGAGVGADYSAFHVIDLENGLQVAEFYNNKTNLEDYKNILSDVGNYYNKAKISIERNSLGAPIVSFFTDTLQYENFYYHRKSKTSYTPGFPVTAGNRGGMLASLQSTFTKNEITIQSVRCISELRSFGYHGNGKLGGMNGEHDDLVLALAQFCFLRQTFFYNENTNEWGEEFLENIKAEEERIRQNHFSNYEKAETSKENEIMALMQGYSIPEKEMNLWRAKHRDILGA